MGMCCPIASPLCYVGLTLLIIGIIFGTIGFIIYRKAKKQQQEIENGIINLGTIAERVEKLEGEKKELEDIISKRYEERSELTYAVADLNIEQTALKREIEIQKDLSTTASKTAQKEFELQMEKQKTALNAQLTAELLELEKQHPKTVLVTELAQINEQIEQARKTLRAWQEQVRSEEKEADFVAHHSIHLSPSDLRDIELIRQFSPQLSRQECFFKLIWTEFYQKPIQQLCKNLSSEKIRGIYKLTNTKNKKMYIGQAVDIAARWKDHCKTGLGIGSLKHKTNKFYKALHEEGIENFTFEMLEIGNDVNLMERERYWIEFHDAVSFGYNSKVG